ncbi:MAG: aminoacyl-tRNA hydrolase [bacterium]
MGVFASKASAEPVDASGPAPYLIVGLGNPGAKYARNRHNVGFMAVDAFAAHHGLDFKGLQKNCHVARGVVHGSRVLLAKPMTFMNNSGEGVSQLIKYYKVPLERVIVLVDDLDTAPGKVKLKRSGGHGGQNGIRSIIDMVGSREFARVKIGIGRSAGQGDVVGWVLSDFRGEEAEALPGQLEEVRHVVEAVIKLGMEKALSGVKIGDEEERKRKREERLRRKREAAEREAAEREAAERAAQEAGDHGQGEGGEENEPASKRQEVDTQ